MKDELVPFNEHGKATDLAESITLANIEDANDCFNRAYKRMLNPPLWHKLCGNLSASFILADKAGNEVHRLATEGDKIKIDIPGPGNAVGEGFDWVTVTKIRYMGDAETAEEQIGMSLQTMSALEGNTNKAAHFFKSGASSTFIIKREGLKVTASYFGRNEVPNIQTGDVVNNIRNAVIAVGAIAGLSELQWHSLIKSFLEAEIGG
ncbi:hypothetical protein [Taibaiella soli]|uniref:Uncharacterized protein n=1 Tax=Taibaiella soli TaxID=1649169 RepID=A0A2W2ATK7_9BACT|nr:hypothetical protein [Taibaiella soli]PZF71284.1 hypothetical protein DN068_18470 [Taibaiella soli]